VTGTGRAGLALAVVATAWLLVGLPASAALAQAAPPSSPAVASPTPVPTLAATTIDAGDPRSDGQGPGLVGEPLLVLAGIVLVGVATVVGTIVIARATGRA
jgi:hypothetical protein